MNENQLTEKDDSKFHGFRIISGIFRIASIVVVLGSFPNFLMLLTQQGDEAAVERILSRRVPFRRNPTLEQKKKRAVRTKEVMCQGTLEKTTNKNNETFI